MAGRFAPSPTGDLHVGNLRTALLAWLLARSTGRAFVVRMEDLDRVTASPEAAARQLADLAVIGLDWDGDVVFQSERFDLYRAAIDRLATAGRVYPCFCTRREIRAEIDAAAAAPHASAVPIGAYPGTCRDLSDGERAARAAAGRPAALRLRTEGERIAVVDRFAGRFEGSADDVVLARADGVPAYNLAVVVDDAAQGVTQVVRGDDLLDSTPRQILLQHLLGYPRPEYAHVPLVVDEHGARLAKRHTAVTLGDLVEQGWEPAELTAALGRSLGIPAGRTASATDLLDRFDPVAVPHQPATLSDLLAR
jgi:glutamyl-tRNA synthetase